MTFNQIPQAIAAAFLATSDDPQVIIALILALLLFIGMFMDINAMLIILAPVLAPLAASIGMDPVHAGIMIVLASVTGERIENIARSLWPFLIAEVAVLFAVAYWPALTLTVPRWMGLTN